MYFADNPEVSRVSQWIDRRSLYVFPLGMLGADSRWQLAEFSNAIHVVRRSYRTDGGGENRRFNDTLRRTQVRLFPKRKRSLSHATQLLRPFLHDLGFQDLLIAFRSQAVDQDILIDIDQALAQLTGTKHWPGMSSRHSSSRSLGSSGGGGGQGTSSSVQQPHRVKFITPD